MAQCRHALKPDGLFLAAMFGGQTLQVREGCWEQAGPVMQHLPASVLLPVCDTRVGLKTARAVVIVGALPCRSCASLARWRSRSGRAACRPASPH